MNPAIPSPSDRALASHEMRFASLHDPGRGIVVPCDATGTVDLDHLPERLRTAYLGARAMLGREYAYPIVQRVHGWSGAAAN